MPISEESWNSLVRRFESIDCAQRFEWLDCIQDGVKVVRGPTDDDPFLHPYLPFVGPHYSEGGLLVYATAQNLAGGASSKADWWPSCVGFGRESLWRLYHQSCRQGARGKPYFASGPGDLTSLRHGDIPLAPVADGILVALAGLFANARSGRVISSLDDVLAHLACTNFFKFSLITGNRDFNPFALRDERSRRRYIDETATLFVDPELSTIDPGTIMVFGAEVANLLRARSAGRYDVVHVNDPSWIKQGMGGVASPSGSWRRKVEATAIPPEVEKLTQSYLDQCHEDYRGDSVGGGRHAGRKRDAARIYLLKYWLDFQDLADG